MMLRRLLQMWKVAAKDLGLEIISPFLLTLPSGIHLKALFFVKNFGAEKGMLILTDHGEADHCIYELRSEGYGFSVLDEPRENESYSRQDFIELLEDWGWSGDDINKPKWL